MIKPGRGLVVICPGGQNLFIILPRPGQIPIPTINVTAQRERLGVFGILFDELIQRLQWAGIMAAPGLNFRLAKTGVSIGRINF